MNEFVKNLYNDLLEELSVYADLGTLPVRKLTGALSSIGGAVAKLQNFITTTSFETTADEIRFFKYDKPAFIAEQFYAMEIFTIEAARPLNDVILLKTFYEQELRYIRRFLEQNKFLFTYYQNDMQALDHLLFVRGAKPTDIPVPDIIGLDSVFNTCCDNLFAKFMAFERLQQYLLAEIYSLECSSNAGKPGIGNALKFTGETINLVELAYGLWLTGQINNGKATVTEIIESLESCFNVKIGRAYRRWTSIAARKRISVTKFIDELREAILKRLDDENSL